ncbi:MAG TPA: ABC transporter ATP-binding protein [Anaerolineaceae bacterium]
MAFLEISNVNKSFGTFNAVINFNLQMEKGEFVSFLGPSGCGKTTTLRMVAGFETPTSGIITIDGQDMTYRPPNQRNVGMVFQSYALFPNMTVASNIGFGLTVAHQARAEIDERVDEMLRLIHMESFGKRYPYQLSGGQQQRVALARALAIHPQVLLLDEPLSALDAKIRLELRTEIRMIQRKLGITTIYVTHDQEEALSLSDRVVVMSQGHIEQIGSPFEIYNYPATPFVASFVGTLNVVEARVLEPAQGLLEVDGQQIRTSSKLETGQRGQTIKLALRPEIISMQPNGASGNQLNGKIENVLFLGSIVRIQARVGKDLISFDTFNNPHSEPPKPGTDVRVHFPEESVMVMGESV